MSAAGIPLCGVCNQPELFGIEHAVCAAIRHLGARVSALELAGPSSLSRCAQCKACTRCGSWFCRCYEVP